MATGVVFILFPPSPSRRNRYPPAAPLPRSRCTARYVVPPREKPADTQRAVVLDF